MSYKNENMKMIELHENGLDIQFRIRENGVVELADFSSQEVKKAVMEPTKTTSISPLWILFMRTMS